MAQPQCPATANQNIHTNEIQISIDPISLRESSRREPSFNLMLPPLSVSPNSPPSLGSSSLRFSFTLFKNKLKHESHASPRQMARHSAALGDFHHKEPDATLRRSKSCAQVQPSMETLDDFDLLFGKPKPSSHVSTKLQEANKEESKKEEEFKCSALCIYLPGFGKGKVVRSKKEETDVGGVISRTVSLEKFECGSWASSAIMNDYEGDAGYFDLPLELIQSSGNDTSAPVSAAFVFDKDRKGALKNESRRKSNASDRHVRFSGSSPSSTCISPRLRKARADFSAFLEAQAA